jgi:hypothetical protein
MARNALRIISFSRKGKRRHAEWLQKLGGAAATQPGSATGTGMFASRFVDKRKMSLKGCGHIAVYRYFGGLQPTNGVKP